MAGTAQTQLSQVAVPVGILGAADTVLKGGQRAQQHGLEEWLSG